MTKKQEKILYITFLALGLFAFIVLLVDEKKYFSDTNNNPEIVNVNTDDVSSENNSAGGGIAEVESTVPNSGELDASGTSQNNSPVSGNSQSSGNQPSNNPTSSTNNPNPPVSNSGSGTPATGNTATPPATPPSSPRLPIEQLQPPTAPIPTADLGGLISPPSTPTNSPTNQSPAILVSPSIPSPVLNAPGSLVLPNLAPHPLVEWRIDSGLCILGSCQPVIIVIYSDGRYEKNNQLLNPLSASDLSLLKQQIEQLNYTSLLSRAVPQSSSAYGCSSSFGGLSHTKYQYVFYPTTGAQTIIACDHEISSTESPFQLLGQLYSARP